MKKVGTITWWNQQKNLGAIEIKNTDYTIEQYFLLRNHIVKCVPDAPAMGTIAVFDVSTKTPPEGKLPEAIRVEIYNSQEEMRLLLDAAKASETTDGGAR